MSRISIVAVALSVGLFLVIIELVRRRTLSERYSLLWLLTSAILISLSVWSHGLGLLSQLLGIYYPPAALLLVAVGFILLILLHYSLVISRLTERQKDLIQRCAILAWRLEELEAAQAGEQPRSRRPA
jgi:hypothetical protein